jgi:c(7)-type cytochrome triheme protein
MNKRCAFFILTVTFFTCSLAYAIDIKDVTMKIANFGKVVFSHNQHFKQEGIKNNCKACHNAIFNLRGKRSYTMADMEKGKSCGACHNGKRAFDLKNCIQCHKVADVHFKVKETGPVRFAHKTHLKGANANSCALCHPKLYDMAPKRTVVTMTQMEKGKSCGACHNGKEAFKIEDCTKCHPTRDVEIKLKDAGDVKFSHDFHAGLYKCGDCHIKLYLPSTKNKRVTKEEMEKGKSCGACHIESKEAFTVKENCDRCHKM